MAVEIEFDDVPTAGPSIDDIEFDDPTRQALSYGSARDPDKHAHLVSIADRERLPVDMVERNQAELEKRSAPRPVTIDDIEFDSPVTTGALADPDTAAMSHDDLDNLSALERIYRKQQAPKTGIMEGAGKAFQRVEDEYWSLSKRLHSAVKRANLGMMAGVLSLGADFERSREEALIKRQAGIESGERRDRPAVRGIPGIPGEMTVQEKLRQAPKTRAEAERSLMDAAQAYADVPQDEKILEFSALVDSTQEKRGTAAAMGEGVMYLLKNPSLFAVLAAEQVTPAAFIGGGGGAILGGVASKQIANRIVSQAAKKYVERSVTMAGVQFGSNMAMTYGPEIAQGLNDGLTVTQAITRARNKSLAESGANAAFAFIPTAGGRVAQILQEATKQGVAGATGAAVGAAAVGEDITLSELMLEGFGELTSTPVDLAFTGMPEQQQRIQRLEMKEGGKILQGSIDQMKLDELVEVAKRNKLGDRNGERFNSFFQTVRDTYGEQQVFIDGDEVAGVIDDMDPNLPGVQEMRRQLQQGGDISLPIDVYVADIARTEVGDTIRPHVRMDAEGLSQIELQEATPQMEERIRQMMERADIEAQDIEAADTLTGQIFDQLMETGRVSRQVARMQSALIPAAVSARAKEYGVTFDEMAQRLGFGGVVGPEVAPDADAFEQGRQVNENNPYLFEFDPNDLVATESDFKDTADYKGDASQPITVTDRDGKVEILDGHHRAKLAKESGSKVRGIMIPIADVQQMEADGIHQGEMLNEWVARGGGKLRQVADVTEQQDPDIQALAEFNQQPDEYQFDNFEVRETAINNLVGRLVPDDQFTGMQMPTGSGFVSITPSAKEPGSWQVTQFDEAGQPTGDGGIQTKEEALRDFFSEARPDLAGERSVLNQARVAGYEGDIKGEAEAWLNAQRKGLDMSQEARMERARAMGFDVDTTWYHGTRNVFSEFQAAGQAAGLIFFTTEPGIASEYSAGDRSGYGEMASWEDVTNIGIQAEDFPQAFDGLTLKEDISPDVLADILFNVDTPFSSELDQRLESGEIDSAGAIAEFNQYVDEITRVGSVIPVLLKASNPANSIDNPMPWREAEKLGGRDIQAQGFDSIYVTEADGIALAVLDPSQIRSVHAAFDPDSAGSADILAQSSSGISARDLQSQIRAENPDLKISLSERGDVAVLDKIIVPDSAREAGTGTAVMNRILEWADANGKTVALTPSADFGGTKKRLTEFYKRFGFVENKGRNKDFEISESMYRPASEQVASLEQSAFHGTPHKFDKFSLESIGTGEGAQAYGWGLYFASNRGIAEYYRDTLNQGATIIKRGRNDYAIVDAAGSEIKAGLLYGQAVRMKEEYDNKQGQLFQVDIPESDQLLDWDKPLSEQPEAVTDALQQVETAPVSLDSMTDEELANLIESIDDDADTEGLDRSVLLELAEGMDASEYVNEPVNMDQTGKAFYLQMTAKLGSDKAASEYLNSIGIPGLKYLDSNTRGGRDEDSHNFVIWDENTVTVEAVNDEVRQAERLAQQRQESATTPRVPRAEFDVKARTIHLLEASDPSSFIHEAGHLFLEFEKQLSAEFGMTDRQKVLLDWLGVDSFDKIKRDQHEQFARGFEAYAFEGKAPSRDLVPMFSSFRRWLIEIYKKIRNLDVMLTPEIRDYFDHILATDEQIAEMQANPDYDQFFVSIEQAGMTQAEWDDYQARQAKRTERATNTLEQKILARLKRKYTKEWQDELAETKDQARSELMEQDVYRAVAFLRGDLVIDGQEGNKMDRARVNEILGLAPPKEKPSKEVDPEKDSLLVAIAKLGGIDRQEAEAQGIDPENWKGKNAGTINQPVFGKRIFGLNGQSFDAMRETLAGYSYNFETANLLLEAIDSELRGDLIYSDAADYDLVFGMREDPETKPLPRSLWGTSKKGGLDPDQVALDFGFRSGDEMLQAISNSPEIHVETNRIAQERMIRKHGDILNDGTIEQEARSAAQNEEHGKVLLQELRALNKQAGARSSIDRESLKIGAAKVIAEAKISDINPQRFYRAEVKSAQKAAKALADGDIDAARMYKTQQLANHYLYKEASQAKDRVVTMRKYLSGVRTRKFNTKQVDAEYVHQMKILAAAYDFKAGKRKEDQAKQSLLDLANWINEQMGRDEWITPQFMDPTLSEMIAIKNNDALDFDEKTQLIQQLTIPRYSDMTMEQLQGAYDMVRNLRYVGGRLSASEAEAFKTLTEEAAESIITHGGKDVKRPLEQSSAYRLVSALKQFGAEHVVMGNQISEMDGYQNFGVMFKAFYQGILDATNNELALKREVHDKLEGIFGKFKRKDLAKGFRESGHAGRRTITKKDGKEWTLSRRARLMLAAYWGSPESRQALLDGNEVTEVDAVAMISTLDNKELDFVQSIWDLNESLWPQVRETALKMTGVSPPKVDHVPFEVNGRKMPGGYIRLYYDYDARDSFLADRTEESQLTRSGGHTMKNTKHGSRNERVGSGGRPVSLELDNLFRALDENIHDISFAETSRDSYRFLQARPVRDAIVQKYGKEKYETLLASLEGVVAGSFANNHPVNSFLRYLRTNASYAMLGYSIRNTMQQPVAFTNVMGKIGERYTLKGMAEFLFNPGKARDRAKWIQERSEFMRQRTSLVNRETAEISNKLEGGLLAGPLQRHAFDLQTMGDAMVAYPAWYGAYLKGLNDFGSEKRAITFADEMVAQTIGSGLMKDLSPLMQGSGQLKVVGPEMIKSLTFMGSFFNKVANLTRDAYKSNDLKTVRGAAEFSRQMSWYLMVPATLSALIVGDLPGEDDDEGWLAWAASRIRDYGLAQIFVMRDMVYLWNGFTPSTPYTRAVTEASRSISLAGKIATGEKEADAEALAKLTRNVAAFVPLPGAGQAARTIEGAVDAAEGNDRNLYQMLVEGKERD